MKAHNMYNSWMQHLFELISFLATVPEPSNFSHVRACICKEWQKMVYTVDFGVKFVAISCGRMRTKVVSSRSLWIFSNLMVWFLHVLHLWAGWWNPNQQSCLGTYHWHKQAGGGGIGLESCKPTFQHILPNDSAEKILQISCQADPFLILLDLHKTPGQIHVVTRATGLVVHPEV